MYAVADVRRRMPRHARLPGHPPNARLQSFTRNSQRVPRPIALICITRAQLWFALGRIPSSLAVLRGVTQPPLRGSSELPPSPPDTRDAACAAFVTSVSAPLESRRPGSQSCGVSLGLQGRAAYWTATAYFADIYYVYCRAPRTPRLWSNCTVPASVGSTSSLEYFLQVCQYYAGSGPAASCAGMGLPGPSESALQLDDIDAGRSKLGAFRSILAVLVFQARNAVDAGRSMLVYVSVNVSMSTFELLLPQPPATRNAAWKPFVTSSSRGVPHTGPQNIAQMSKIGQGHGVGQTAHDRLGASSWDLHILSQSKLYVHGLPHRTAGNNALYMVDGMLSDDAGNGDLVLDAKGGRPTLDSDPPRTGTVLVRHGSLSEREGTNMYGTRVRPFPRYSPTGHTIRTSIRNTQYSIPYILAHHVKAPGCRCQPSEVHVRTAVNTQLHAQGARAVRLRTGTSFTSATQYVPAHVPWAPPNVTQPGVRVSVGPAKLGERDVLDVLQSPRVGSHLAELHAAGTEHSKRR
ncbi:hypothetical protein C2E23DRAFT_855638 [Lenzites betulinus]|nr:hypothetical protein C2E23DRAFT_855638 [Lenzites betulinus]